MVLPHCVELINFTRVGFSNMNGSIRTRGENNCNALQVSLLFYMYKSGGLF